MKHGKILFATLLFFVALSLSLYAQVPLSDGMAASGVLGTSDFVTNTGWTAPTTTTFAEPACLAVDPTTGKLFVADRDNNRVLRFSVANKTINGSAAEAVFGQADFTSRLKVDPSTMNYPNSIHVDASGTLWVVDRDNNRVLKFNNASGLTSPVAVSAANVVLGQATLSTNATGTTASAMSGPKGLFVDASGKLWVADGSNNRVLRFDAAASKANGAAADGVLGQALFTTSSSGTSSSTMAAPWGVYVDGAGRLWVADRDNNRVLRFDGAASKSNGGTADGVLGQSNFNTGSSGGSQSTFVEPRGTFVDGLGRLYVADEGNSRIMIFTNAAAKANGANADNVLGQADFSGVSGATTSTGLSNPLTVFADNTNNHLWVADVSNHRVLRYDVAPLPVELVSFTAKSSSGKVELTWSTATETNNAGFEVEKSSINGWSKIGFVEGNGTSNTSKNYSFVESSPAGKYQYRLKQIDRDGKFEYSNIVEATVTLIAGNYTLGQNYPNPFNPSTSITFALKNSAHATITVHNILGQEVAILFNGIANANELYTLSFDAKNLPSGVYFYSLQSAGRNEVKKMNLMK